MKKAIPALLVLLLVGTIVVAFRVKPEAGTAHHRLIILGIDGMDPQLLRSYMQQGRMPNFSALAAQGSFREIATTTPPQSPVAWSTVITGLAPGGHGIFDFIHRDPRTMQPFFSTSRAEGPKHVLRLGNWVLPLTGGRAEQLRHGRAFWEILEDHGVPAVVLRMPANFPPVPTHAQTLSGMGTPDLRGTYGTFTFYTDDPTAAAGSVEGGRIVPVHVEASQVHAELIGPDNTFRMGAPPARVEFTVSLDPVEPVALVAVQENEFVLREGEWSNWVRVEFSLVPGLVSVKGMCRFFLKQAEPRFQLYVSPLNLDPLDPALPISTPEGYARQLALEIGPFHTLGIAEDTKALSDGVLDDGEYLQQARQVLAEQRRMLEAELSRFHSGVFFFYFSTLDLNGHMFWRSMDASHPVRTAADEAETLPRLYSELDAVLGQVRANLDGDTTLLVLSDHGFAPYRRSFNLNTWLLDHGYIVLKPGEDQESGEYFAHVDWSRTRAYALGLNGLYLNLRGRERDGIVRQEDVQPLLAEIRERLLAERDPETALAVITRADRASDVYQGEFSSQAPDLLIGYNRGYRAGWKTILGAFPRAVLEDNTNAWSGDHCIDPSLVPGVLLSNREIAVPNPALTDIAPTILAEFGIAKPSYMQGKVLLAAGHGMVAHNPIRRR